MAAYGLVAKGYITYGERIKINAFGFIRSHYQRTAVSKNG